MEKRQPDHALDHILPAKVVPDWTKISKPLYSPLLLRMSYSKEVCALGRGSDLQPRQTLKEFKAGGFHLKTRVVSSVLKGDQDRTFSCQPQQILLMKGEIKWMRGSSSIKDTDNRLDNLH